jgi:ABC-type spermidine/putrescine transport system permease subunit I
MYKLTGFGWKNVLPSWGPDIVPSYMKGYGYSLWVVYAVWVGIMLLVYPICLRYDKYKQAHKEKWWLSYL